MNMKILKCSSVSLETRISMMDAVKKQNRKNMKWLKFKMFWRTLFHKNQYKAVYELNQVAQPDFSNMKAYKGETK